MEHLFDSMQGSQYFTTLYLRCRYNEVRIRNEDVARAATKTPGSLGHFQVVTDLSFGICNAPATFQSLMNEVLRPCVRTFSSTTSWSLTEHIDRRKTWIMCVLP